MFLLDMGKPVQIADLAKSLVFLHGKTLKDEENPNGEIEIEYTGLRAGEKLFEELLIDETAVPTSHSKISRAREAFLPWSELLVHLDKIDAETLANPGNNMITLLRDVVPGYEPDKRSLRASGASEEPQPSLSV